MIVSFSNFFLQAVELSETRAMQKYGSKLLPIKFPGCELYEFRSDEYWACAARQVTTNLHHQVSTHLQSTHDIYKYLLHLLEGLFTENTPAYEEYI